MRITFVTVIETLLPSQLMFISFNVSMYGYDCFKFKEPPTCFASLNKVFKYTLQALLFDF